MSSSGVSIDSVRSVLTSAINPTHLRILDTSGGCGAKFELYIASDQFTGQSLINRHRIVQTALTESGLMKQIHAVSIKAWLPTEWESKKDKIPEEAQ